MPGQPVGTGGDSGDRRSETAALSSATLSVSLVFIRLEARLRPNIGNTLSGASTVFTRSAITPPK